MQVTADDGQVLGYETTASLRDQGTTVVFLPAMGVPLGYYGPLIQAWSATGAQVVGLEHRGQPLSPTSRGFGYSDLVRRDLPAVFGLSEVRDAGRVLLVGHSMGGAIALLATAAGLVRPHAVATIATGTSWCAAEFGPYRRARRHLAVDTVRSVSAAFGYWPGQLLGFGGRQPSTLMRDWAHEARHARFDLFQDPYDYEAAMARLSTPRLMLGVEGDPLINGRAVALLARRAGRASRKHLHLGQVNHFNWARRTPAPVVSELNAWFHHL